MDYLDRERFLQLAAKYKDTVFRVALNALGSPHDADDVVQDTLIKLYRCGKSFESDEHARNWMIRVALNLSKNVLRSPWRRRVPLDEGSPAPDCFSSPEESELYAEVMALSERYRTVLYLFYYEEYSVREIAGLLGVSETAVTSRLSRARQMLKSKLTEEFKDE